MMNEITMTPAEIRAALKTIGWSADHFGRVLGVAPGTVRNWTLGRNRIPEAHAWKLLEYVAAFERVRANDEVVW